MKRQTRESGKVRTKGSGGIDPLNGQMTAGGGRTGEEEARKEKDREDTVSTVVH